MNIHSVWFQNMLRHNNTLACFIISPLNAFLFIYRNTTRSDNKIKSVSFWFQSKLVVNNWIIFKWQSLMRFQMNACDFKINKLFDRHFLLNVWPSNNCRIDQMDDDINIELYLINWSIFNFQNIDWCNMSLINWMNENSF